MDEHKSIPDGLQGFLRKTDYCDFDNPIIKETADWYVQQYPDSKTRAVELFKFVRDNIKYRVGRWDKKASVTISEKYGMCTNSTNLLVALLRASKIPAGYCIYTVVGGESFGHILPNIIKRHVHKDSVHIVANVYLGGKWIKCDPSTDKQLSDSSRHISKLTNLIVWDGEHDAVHEMQEEHIINISEPLANIDYQLEKKPRFLVRTQVFHVANLFIDFLRTQGHIVKSAEHLDNEFKKWFKKNHRLRYYIFHVFSLYHETKNRYFKK